MKVVFLQDVPGVARLGDIKKVKRGHARNYLLPKGFAVPATPEEIRRAEARKRNESQRREERAAEAHGTAGAVDGISLVFAKRVTSKGNIYGSVSSTAIHQELKKLGHEVEKSMIKLEDPLRQLGEHEVEIEFTKDAVARIKITIEPAEAEKTPESSKESEDEDSETPPEEDSDENQETAADQDE